MIVIITWLLLQELSAPKVTLLQLPPFLDMSFVEYGIVKGKLEWESDKKPLNPMRKTEEENRETNENILAHIGKTINHKRLCCWWKTSQSNDKRLRGKTRQKD